MFNGANECAAEAVMPTIIFLLSPTSVSPIRDEQAVSLCHCIVLRPPVLIALSYVRTAAR